MKSLLSSGKDYLKKLQSRSKDSRIHYDYQFLGLEIATMLRDLKHKSLYIKMAKEHDGAELLAIAKSVATRADIENPGAYFMSVVKNLRKKDENLRNIR